MGQTKAIEGAMTSPYLTYDRKTWAALCRETVTPLSVDELKQLTSLGETISLDEVRDIYQPLSQLLRLYMLRLGDLNKDLDHLLANKMNRAPFIFGIAGSVVAGKSTTARVLKALLERLPEKPSVDLITTDGFLMPNAELEKRNLMNRKGFPESYDIKRLLRFLADVKGGKKCVKAPQYSHLTYDIVPNAMIEVRQPDVLIFEGLNVLQPATLPPDGRSIPYVSDFFDFSLYLDADEKILERWFLKRFLNLRASAFKKEESYFHAYAELTENQAIARARFIWRTINQKNLRQNILPTRGRARLILHKAIDHHVCQVDLRRI